MSGPGERALIDELNRSANPTNSDLESFDSFSKRFRKYLADTDYWRQRRKLAAAKAVEGRAFGDEAHEHGT